MLYCFKRRVFYELFKVAQQAFSSQIRTIVTTFSFKKANYNHSWGTGSHSAGCCAIWVCLLQNSNIAVSAEANTSSTNRSISSESVSNSAKQSTEESSSTESEAEFLPVYRRATRPTPVQNAGRALPTHIHHRSTITKNTSVVSAAHRTLRSHMIHCMPGLY